jgi:hypothetical protein
MHNFHSKPIAMALKQNFGLAAIEFRTVPLAHDHKGGFDILA